MKKISWLVVLVEFAAAATAAVILLPDYYHVARYRVDAGPPQASNYLVFLGLVCLVASGAYAVRRTPTGQRGAALAVAWLPLLANLFVPARAALGRAPFFLEPLIIALSSAAALGLSIAAALPRKDAASLPAKDSRLPAAATAALFLLAAVWMYALQAHFLSTLQYGWTDAGLYYMRVKNTAIGRGFLQEALWKPPFYDHFDVGLLILVPVYWLFPTYKIIMWTQALFLAAAGPATYVYARGRGLGGWTAVAFGAAAVLFPGISQMSYSWSYGFHPITIAIPAAILSIHFWEKGRWWLFAAAAVFAASMEETVFPLYAGIGLIELIAPRGRRWRGAVLVAAAAGLFALVTRVVMPAFAGAEYGQMVKYAHLGANFREIVLSPFEKPRLFWGLLFDKASISFLALILASMCMLPFLAPRQLLYPAAVLVFTLLLQNPNVKIIAYQYQSLTIAAWFPAMIVGAERLSRWRGARGPGRVLAAAAASAVMAAFLMAHFYGLLPYSRLNVPFQNPRSAGFLRDARTLESFAATVRPPARVLATMRAAMLFCDAGDVTPLQNWDYKTTDYDVVVLEPYDNWGQSSDDLKRANDEIGATGQFVLKPMGRFIVFVRQTPIAPPA